MGNATVALVNAAMLTGGTIMLAILWLRKSEADSSRSRFRRATLVIGGFALVWWVAVAVALAPK